MPLDTVRLSQTARDQLVQMKRHCGIGQWNVLCRWAYCLSLAEASPPRKQPVPSDSNVEMTWRTFGGADDEVFRELAFARQEADSELGLNPADNFRLHLHRGIGYLTGDRDRRSIEAMVRLVIEDADQRNAPSTAES